MFQNDAAPSSPAPKPANLGAAIGKAVYNVGKAVGGSTGAKAPAPYKPTNYLGSAVGKSVYGAGAAVGKATGAKAPAPHNFGNISVARQVAQANPNPTPRQAGGLMAAVTPSSLGDAGSFMLKEAGALGRDAISLPGTTVKGLVGLGGSAVSDLLDRLGLHGTSAQFGALNGAPTHTEQILSNAWNSSATKHLFTGDLAGTLKMLEQHPLYTGLEAAGDVGAIGRIAGAAGRAGMLGDAGRAAASTRRADLQLVPDLPGQVQHYSPNLFTKQIQKAIENSPAAQRFFLDARVRPGMTDTGIMRPTLKSGRQVKLTRQLDSQYANSRAAGQAAQGRIAEALKAERQQAGSAANAVPLAAMRSITDPAEFEAQLKARLAALQQAANDPKMLAQDRQVNLTHQEQIQKILNDPAAMNEAHNVFGSAQGYIDRQNQIDAELARLNIKDPEQMRKAALSVYAMDHIPGVVYDAGGEKTLGAQMFDQAQKDLKQSKAELAAAKQEAERLKNAHASSPEATQLKNAEKALADARARQAKAQGTMVGRYGVTNGTDPALKAVQPTRAVDAVRIDSHAQKVAEAQAARDAAAAKVEQLKNDNRDYARELLASKKDTLQDAYKQKSDATDALMKHGKVTQPGWKVADPTVTTPYTAAHGTGLSPLTEDFVRSHMEDRGVTPGAYVNLRAADAAIKRGLVNKLFTRGGTAGPKRIGQTYREGTYTPGFDSLIRSQLSSQATLNRAKALDDVINRFGIKDVNGQYFSSPQRFKEFARQYKEEHGVDLVAVPAHPKSVDEATAGDIHSLQDPSTGTLHEDPSMWSDANGQGHIVAMPQDVVNRYNRWSELDARGMSAPAMLSRQFRNVVLPFSTRRILGSVLESTMRNALVGAGPRDRALARAVAGAMQETNPEAAGNLLRETNAGLEGGMLGRINAEQEAQGVGQKLRNIPVLGKVVSGYSDLVHGIFHAQHVMENQFAQATLGSHMARDLQEHRDELAQFMQTWTKAATTQHEYAVRFLADRYADPQLAYDAGKYIRDTLGQYNHFSPAMQQFVRSISPFGPWHINAAKFTYYTLPAKHPFAQSVIAQSGRAMPNWDSAHDVPHDTTFGLSTGGLQSALKVGPDQYVELGYHLPEGAFTSGPAQYLQQLLIPQYAGALHALSGQDPFGAKFTGPNGEDTDAGHHVLYALNQLLTSFVPGAEVAQHIGEGGRTQYNTSTLWDWRTKPGTQHQTYGLPGIAGAIAGGLSKQLNPLHPVFLKPKTSSPAAPPPSSAPNGVHLVNPYTPVNTPAGPVRLVNPYTH